MTRGDEGKVRTSPWNSRNGIAWPIGAGAL